MSIQSMIRRNLLRTIVVGQVAIRCVSCFWCGESHVSFQQPPRCGLVFARVAAKPDPVRESTKIRPSLHPVTINAIAEALKIRSSNIRNMPLRSTSDIKPIQVALTAGRIASEAIHKRQMASDDDGMRLEQEEEQTIAGRVVGVVMRLPELENKLYQKGLSAPWIAKYNEWSNFGLLLPDEQDKEGNTQEESLLAQRILSDPLFTLARAECLLALYLDQVERPCLGKIGQSVPDGTTIDFLDTDRSAVLLGQS